MWISQSDSLLAYPAILTLHTFGLAIVVGINAAIDLRILGWAPKVPLAPLEKFIPIMWGGFGINLASGILLFIAAAATKGVLKTFYLKLTFVAIGLLLVPRIRESVFRDPASLATGRTSSKARWLATVSLLVWLGAIIAGRLMAYV